MRSCIKFAAEAQHMQHGPVLDRLQLLQLPGLLGPDLHLTGNVGSLSHRITCCYCHHV